MTPDEEDLSPPAPGAARRRSMVALRRTRSLIQVVVACGAVVAATTYAYVQMFTRFSDFDDEGYVMASVKNFLDGMPLYDAVFTQYGPFYYLVRKVLFATARVPVTHDVTRLIGIVHWIAMAGLCGWCVYRLTRAASWAIVTFLQVTLHCWGLVLEPGHPQELVVLLLAASIAVAAAWPASTVGLLLLGILAACMLLTKINVGLYAAVALAVSWLSLCPPGDWSRLALVGAGAVATLLPALLMRRDLTSWAGNYALVASLATAACCVWAGRPRRPAHLQPRHVMLGALGFGGGVAAGAIVTILLGTSPAALVEGTVLRPMQLVFTIPFQLGPTAVRCGVLSFLLAATLAVLEATGWLSQSRLETIGTVLKLALGIQGLYVLHRWPTSTMTWIAPFLWIVLVPSSPDGLHLEHRFPRTVLGLLAVLQLLMAYPVAGTQRALSTYLIVPLLVVCVADAWTRVARSLRQPVVAYVELALLAGIVLVYAPTFDPEAQLVEYHAGTRTALWRFERARLPADTVRRYQWMVSTLVRHCDTFVTMPGFNSLYFWTRMAPPTGYNATAWMTLLTDAEQEQIVRALAEHPNACVIYNSFFTRFLAGRANGDWPLATYIRASFRTVLKVGGDEFMIRNERPWSGDDPDARTLNRP